MAQLPDRKKRKYASAKDENAEEEQQPSVPEEKKTRRQIVSETILDRFHRSQQLQGILRKGQHPVGDNQSDQDQDQDDAVVEEPEQPPPVQLTAEEQHEADQVLNDVNKLRKEKKKKLAKDKKKFKAEQTKLRLQQEAEAARKSKQERALAYLKQWKKHRDEWKFKKVNHIWLLKNWKHSSRIPDKRFKTFLKYLKSQQKSLALQRLEQEAKTIVDSSEEQEAAAVEGDETTNQSYQRARSILQWIV